MNIDEMILCLFAVMVAAIAAQEYNHMHPYETMENYPDWYLSSHESARQRRDVSLDRKVGNNGRVFGTVGQNDNGLFGKAGYDHNIFNDGRGKLDAQAYGTRVLGQAGDTSHFGGALNWKNPNAAASLDVSRQIHGPTSINAAAGGRWPIGKNGDFSAQGFYDKTSGMRHDHGVRAVFNQRW